MSKIKVCVKIRPLSQRDIKLKKEEEWIVTNNNSLQCANSSYPCNFKFDFIFGTKSLNYEVYISIVKPIVESCFIGLNGTILTYGPTSAGKNYTMIGTSMDPGIILSTIEYLFTDGCPRRKIRFGYIEIYKEKIYDLLNNRKPVLIDTRAILSNAEVVVETCENAMEILFSGSYKRKSATEDDSKLSSLSHAIFRITMESEDETNGKVQVSHLSFVHVAGCEPMSEISPSDSLADDSNKSLFWFNVVINGLNKGEKGINFNNSTLTTLLRESLTGHLNTAIICNVKADAVEETLSTLKFVSRAKNIRALPLSSEKHNAQASCSTADDNKMIQLDHQLKEIADLRVGNLLLRKELDEVKAAFAARTKWFEEQMKVSEFVQQKLELARREDKILIRKLKTGFEEKLRELNTGTSDSAHSLLNDSLIHQQNGNSSLTRRSATFLKKQKLDKEVEAGIKRKIERLENELTKNIKILKHELQYKKADVKPSASIEWTRKLNGDTTESRTVNLRNSVIGRVIGRGGVILQSIKSKSGAKITVSERNGDSDRSVLINGTSSSVCMAADMIKQILKDDD